MSPAIEISEVVHRYVERVALDGVSFEVQPAEIFGLLGPNGGGKTTLFRLLSTLIPIQRGEIRVLGCDVRTQAADVRRRIGVVFQAPSLDRKLTVAENLRHQGHLYGLAGAKLRERQGQMLARLGLADRADDLAEKLSGGLRRRVELAKGMLHHPRMLLLDEPSTGLDPGARSDLWEYLRQVRADGVTVLLTTHLLEEAERCDRLAILDRGRLVALDTPDNLRSSIGGDTVTISADDPAALAEELRMHMGLEAVVVDGSLRLELADAHLWVGRVMESFGGRVRAITVGKPTLEDVFIARTGHRFWNTPQETAVE